MYVLSLKIQQQMNFLLGNIYTLQTTSNFIAKVIFSPPITK